MVLPKASNELVSNLTFDEIEEKYKQAHLKRM